MLGQINIKSFLLKTKGEVRGQVVTDAKFRTFSEDYTWQEQSDTLLVKRASGTGDEVRLNALIPLTPSLISFFGLYSGDGAKGSEKRGDPSVILPVISFSQREPNLVVYAVKQFMDLFGESIRFTFSLGEDSAYFMAGEGLESLKKYYGGQVPQIPKLNEVRPTLNTADQTYLTENRNVDGTNDEHLAFYYFHKSAMEEILTEVKRKALDRAGVALRENDKVTASLRRPFKKGARLPGGSSRSDEMHVGGLNGIGPLFLKILYTIEDTLIEDIQSSSDGLIEWEGIPSEIGEQIDIQDFFTNNQYGSLNGIRPSFTDSGSHVLGRWPRGKEVTLKKTLLLTPIFCYVAGLYLAEGSTPKSMIAGMFANKVTGFAFGFTSSENNSLEVLFRAMKLLFLPKDCVDTWKVKVGSQYFPELVVNGLKLGLPMLRGGASGDGKCRTMEISLSIKEWASEVAPALNPYSDKYSHVEPTGAGLARIDVSASSSLCKWIFPLMMYSTFGEYVEDPKTFFVYE